MSVILRVHVHPLDLAGREASPSGVAGFDPLAHDEESKGAQQVGRDLALLAAVIILHLVGVIRVHLPDTAGLVLRLALVAALDPLAIHKATQ